MAQLFNITHNAGNLNEYDSMVNTDGDLSATAGAGLGGTAYGLACLINDYSSWYGQKNVTIATNVVRFRFYLDPNTLTMGSGNSLTIIAAYAGTSSYRYRVRLDQASGGYALYAAQYTDEGGITSGTYALTDEPHYIEVRVDRAATNVSADGQLQLWIDGTLRITVTGCDNYDSFQTVSSFRIGSPLGPDYGTTGTFYLDEFTANDDGGLIGPLASGCTPLRLRIIEKY